MHQHIKSKARSFLNLTRTYPLINNPNNWSKTEELSECTCSQLSCPAEVWAAGGEERLVGVQVRDVFGDLSIRPGVAILSSSHHQKDSPSPCRLSLAQPQRQWPSLAHESNHKTWAGGHYIWYVCLAACVLEPRVHMDTQEAHRSHVQIHWEVPLRSVCLYMMFTLPPLSLSCSHTWKVLNYMPGFSAPRGEEFSPGPKTRLDRSGLLCNKVLLKCEGDRESFWHRHQKGAERVPAC